jgi:hypothetical protein
MSELAKALIRFHKATAGFEADKKGNRSNYASIGAVINNVKEASKYGLTFAQPVDFDERHIFVRTIVMHESGEKIESRYPVIVDDFTNNQKVGGAITYAKRYALASIFGTEKGVEDADDDGEINGLYNDEIKPESNGGATLPPSGEGDSGVSSQPESPASITPKIKRITDQELTPQQKALETFMDKVQGAGSHEAAVEVVRGYVSKAKTVEGVTMLFNRLKPTSHDMVKIFSEKQHEFMKAKAEEIKHG